MRVVDPFGPTRVVLRDDPDYKVEDGDYMQFRLTYEGPLRSTQRDPQGGQRDPRADHKHAIRQAFHVQLKRLWQVSRALNETWHDHVLTFESAPDEIPRDVEALSKKFAMFGWNFVPLVVERLDLLCSVDILLLRPRVPGSLIHAGDIDNRLKTLFDALKLPDAHDRYTERAPEGGEQPFYCLLEDDRLITSVAVETDQLLQPVGNQFDESDVRLVINVKIRPNTFTIGNSHFA